VIDLQFSEWTGAPLGIQTPWATQAPYQVPIQAPFQAPLQATIGKPQAARAYPTGIWPGVAGVPLVGAQPLGWDGEWDDDWDDDDNPAVLGILPFGRRRLRRARRFARPFGKIVHGVPFGKIGHGVPFGKVGFGKPYGKFY
jgi:hypothetical protein